jgi:2-succinyl-5-enolpyruvyl-6-hydroxy-3-cyclohexene-1-carboxylate synthase
VPVLDERTAAFFALGLAKATHRPTLALCTSGTAAANFLPAAVEAWHSETPLLLVTADRPPEQQNCGAGQTINQHAIFGKHVLDCFDLPLPAAKFNSFKKLREVLSTAWQTACGRIEFHSYTAHGPVHLNVPLREPLAPNEPEANFNAQLAMLSCKQKEDVEPITSPLTNMKDVRSVFKNIRAWRFDRAAPNNAAQGIIIAGDANPPNADAYCAAAIELAQLLGWQIFADATNPLRHRAGNARLDDGSPVVVADYEQRLTGDPKFSKFAAWTPAAVIQLGQLPTSKVLRRWLAREPLPTCLFSRDRRNLNPIKPYHHENIEAPFLLEDVVWSEDDVLPKDVGRQKGAGKHSRRTSDSRLPTPDAPPKDPLFHAPRSPLDPALIAALAGNLPDDAALILANSLSVRAAEAHWPATATRRLVFSNRGANGIDGTLGTALGIAAGVAPRPAFLLTGDLAFLHDTNALLLAPELAAAGGSLTVLLVNNAGGGIFRTLAVARDNPHFKRFWLTPQHVNIARLCAAYDIEHTKIAAGTETTAGTDIAAALAPLLAAPPANGLRVIEIFV